MSPGLAALRAFVEAPARCDGCGTTLPRAHDHLVDGAVTRTWCVCAPCGLVGVDAQRSYVRRDAALLPSLVIDDAQWRELELPVGVAVVVRTDAGAPSYLLPGGAGIVRAPLRPDVFARLAALCPALDALPIATHGILLARRGAKVRVARISIDHAFALAATLRGAREPWTLADRVDAALDRMLGGKDGD